MSRRIALGAGAVLLGAGALAAGRAAGFSIFLLGSTPVIWPGGESVRYLSPTTFPDGSPTLEQFVGALVAWSLVPSSQFDYYYAVLDQDYPIDHFDGYSDTSAVATESLDPGTLGITYLVNDGPYWYDMDMLFADSPDYVGWNFEVQPDCIGLSDPNTYGFNFALTALHELGHALGLGHDPSGAEAPGTPFFVATMNPAYPAGGTMGSENIIELHTDDRNGVRHLYPNSGPTAPPYHDLGLANFASGALVGRVEPIGFSPVEVRPSDELAMRTVVENLGNRNEFIVRQGFFLSDDEWITGDDVLIGEVTWDIAFGDAFDVDVVVDLPDDLHAGWWYVGSILDLDDAVAEEYEDNNAVLYCAPLLVEQLAPVIEPIPQQFTTDDVPFIGPTPEPTHPMNMSPLVWSLDNPMPGMTIHPGTGVVSWPEPVASEFQYVIIVRATNDAGAAAQNLFIAVSDQPDPCPHDITGDDLVNTSDLLAILAGWGPCDSCNCPADFTGPAGPDCVVDVFDLLGLLSQWGACE